MIGNRRQRLGQFILLALAALVLHLVFIQPNHPAAMTWGALFLFPLELPAVLFALVAFGFSTWGKTVRLSLVTVLTIIVVWKVADATMFTALNRGFNPLTDLSLVSAFINLISGTFGTGVGVLGVIGAVILTICVAALLWWACGIWMALRPTTKLHGAVVAGAVLSFALATAEVGQAMRAWSLPINPPGMAFTARLGAERVGLIKRTLANMRAFQTAVKQDVYAGQDGLLDLIDRDVFVIFVESYGRTSFDTPQYAKLHQKTLQSAEEDLAARGLTMASTFVASPTRGGQSWLAHATFANGLWVTDQPSYGAVLQSGRETVFHIAKSAGFHTAAVMPQITLAWPESDSMGFDTILAAADLGYAGVPFNWVTMPDQYTFSAMDRILRKNDKPLFVQIALGSSHAPWVPVPEVIPWEDIGDGTIYDPIVAASDTPEVVWKDHDRVRTQYGLAVDYALQSVFAYVALHAEDAPLVFVIGDHQAAGFVALDERPDVPVHVIGPAHLVSLITRNDFHAGLIPPSDVQAGSMKDMRDILLRTFSSNTPQDESS